MTHSDDSSETGRALGTSRTKDVLTKLGGLLQQERLVITGLLSILTVFAIFDFVEDKAQGASSADLYQDVSDLILPLILLAYIWRYKPLSLFKKNSILERNLEHKSSDLQQWKKVAESYIKGLSETIDQQFDRWELSVAEKEVALLLLKGFSLQEIADIRSVSERTVRQQATRVYQRSGLRGRAELSAFFLEDLLLPRSEN